MGQASSSSASASDAAPAPTVLDVELEIVSAKGLKAADVNLSLTKAISSDPYAVLTVGGKKAAWTRPQFETREPVWNEKFFFKSVQPDTICKLSVFDKDANADDALGDTQFTAIDTSGEEKTLELPIKRGEDDAGSITVKVKSQPTSHPSEQVEETGPVRYSEHASVFTGVVTQTVTNHERLESLAFHVQLHNISQFLTTPFEWNKNHKPVQRIFSPDHPEAPVLRKGVQAEHEIVYHHDKDSTVYGQLASPSDLFKLVHDGKREDKPVIFTYVVVEKGWFFSETGAAFFKDMFSKHMMHANAAFSVLYAGEFHIEDGHFGKRKLVLDNGSGTYAPPKEALPHLKALFENNFPGISVEARDKHDPEEEEARKEILAAWGQTEE